MLYILNVTGIRCPGLVNNDPVLRLDFEPDLYLLSARISSGPVLQQHEALRWKQWTAHVIVPQD